MLDDSKCEMEVKKMFLFSQQIDVEAEYKKREQTNKAQINLVVIGKIMAARSFSSCIWYHFVLLNSCSAFVVILVYTEELW